ncbi:hypothetical protein GCM10010404_81910 [Nonomuraea africana]|uniref:DUF317 domain-containing protein n=1 Tax=Nonomuraea africana TaxID=46171 RepID=A0ABR9KX10_9ACTN|nr:hypothetical protein [Nonomuraea africana]MBE1566574.1 hypothetical protein [Nonomuraea africana]
MPETILEEPPQGSVVAIDWGGLRQEVWVSDRYNFGNWYTTDARVTGHPTWSVVVARAQGRLLTLLVAADEDTYRLGYRAGVDAAGHAVAETLDEIRSARPMRGPERG